MIKILNIGPIRVYITPFQLDGDEKPHDAERRAVSRLAEYAAGHEAVIEHNPDGSPYIPGLDETISVSHCRGIAALAFNRAGSRFGIDIERPRATLTRVASKFLTEAERERLAGMDSLLEAWTVKEALYKAAGVPGIPLAGGLPLPDSGGRSKIAVNGRVADFRVVSLALPGFRLSVAYSLVP